MQLDEICLRLMKKRDCYYRYAPALMHSKVFNGLMIHKVLKYWGDWFKEHPEAEEVDLATFKAWALMAHKITDEEAAFGIDDHLEKARGELSEEIEKGMMGRLAQEASKVRTNQIIKDYEEGKLTDLYAELRSNLDVLEKDMDRKGELEFQDFSIGEIIEGRIGKNGLRWRLNCLNESMQPIIGGRFGIIASGVDRGKTSFIASELTYLAAQLENEKKIIWFNNEGSSDEIRMRLYQAALGIPLPHLIEMHKEGVLEAAYAKAIGGARKIEVVDAHGKSSQWVEDMVKLYRPAIVVMDMIDNFTFTGLGNHDGTRTDQILESMYQWARQNVAVKFDCIVFATSQFSIDGYKTEFPEMTCLKDSKVGKQGAADFVMMVGFQADETEVVGPQQIGYVKRFIGLPKNKHPQPAKKKDPKAVVYFDRDRCRFIEDPWASAPSIFGAPGKPVVRPTFGLAASAPAEKDDLEEAWEKS